MPTAKGNIMLIAVLLFVNLLITTVILYLCNKLPQQILSQRAYKAQNGKQFSERV